MLKYMNWGMCAKLFALFEYINLQDSFSEIFSRTCFMCRNTTLDKTLYVVHLGIDLRSIQAMGTEKFASFLKAFFTTTKAIRPSFFNFSKNW